MNPRAKARAERHGDFLLLIQGRIRAVVMGLDTHGEEVEEYEPG
jgi:hypothetical protein